MAERKTPGNDISAHDILRTEIIVNQALIDILLAKQIITEEELVSSIQNIKRDHQKLIKGSDKIVPLKR
jgi:hypothetical protein